MAQSDFRRDVTQDQEFNVHLELGRVFESQKEYTAALAEYQKSLEVCARRGFGAGIKGSGEKQALVHRRIGGRSTGSAGSPSPRTIIASP
ncbi:hypothetical protein V5E97_17835 [Singulisphaera sp. Ch08]|uniref:Tetratricopeptide repeat protein n=1 Tax=Singulisphaera sp. Ch08 TaxID=3120278 RepID=A0AAU7CS18_9BACT